MKTRRFLPVLLPLIALAAYAAAPAKPPEAFGVEGSKVFHNRANCPKMKHAKNKLTWPKIADAQKSGRHLCKACEGRK